MALSLLCDEHIPYSIIEGLRRRSLNVVTVQEISLSSEKDETIMDRARKEGRIIYTRDADFLRLHWAGYQYVGIRAGVPSPPIGFTLKKSRAFSLSCP